MSELIVVAVVVLGTIAVLLALRAWLAASRRRSRAYDTADLEALRSYARARGLDVLSGDDKSAFLATGELEGVAVSLSTAPLEFVLRGRTVVGPIETHLRTRGLSRDACALAARPLSVITGNTAVENPPSRGVDMLPTGDRAFDAEFRSYAGSPEALAQWLDPESREQLRALPQVREVRLGDGELSISLVSPYYVGGDKDTTPWNHVRPLVRDERVIDVAARTLARIRGNTLA